MIKVWLVPNLQLYILASSGDELAALHSRRSEAKVKVVTVHISCSLVNQLTGSYQLCWALLWATEIWLVLKVQRWNGEEDFFNLTLACEDGSRTWSLKTVLSRGSTFIEFEPDFTMLQYYSLVLLCLIDSNSAAEKWLQHWPDIIGGEDENFTEGSAVE